MARRVTTKDKWKSKVWYGIVSPPAFGEKNVGETPANDAKEVIGRRIEVTANEVVSGPKLNQFKLIFEIDGVAGTTAKTKLAGYEMIRSFLRSLVRRRRKRIDFIKNFDLDGQKVRIKVIVMTAGKCYTPQKRDIRKIIDEVVTKNVHGKTVEEVVSSAINREIQNEARERARKVFPIVSVEVRMIQFLG